MRPARAVVPIVTSPSLTRRACSRLWCRGDIAIASTFATSPNNRASSAAASPLTRITCGSCSPARSAARPAMNSLSRSAASTIVWCTVWATKPHGGKTPASIRSMPPASCGRKPAWKKAASLPISPRKPLMRIRDQALLQIGPRHRIKPAPPRPPDPCSPTGSSGRRRRSSCFTPPPAPRSPIADRRSPRNLASPKQASEGWLQRRYYEATGEAPSAAAIRSTLDLLEARAQFDGPERTVHIRIAEHAGHIYLDLADERWRAVDIGPDGWRVSDPARALPPAGRDVAAAPARSAAGPSRALKSFLNLPSRNDFVLVVAWLLATLRAGGPYPLLAISGEQGSAKTVLVETAQGADRPRTPPRCGRFRARSASS